MESRPAKGQRLVITKQSFADLLRVLRDEGYELCGPTARDGAIVYDRIEGIQDLPEGKTDEQAPGHYRLRQRDDGALFGYAVGPHSYKREFLVPSVTLFKIRRGPKGTAIETEPLVQRKIALIGARACEVAAISVQDKVLAGGVHGDADYIARRANTFVLAVHCADPSGTCFCVSMNTGPRVREGFDLALTELPESNHRFVVDIGTELGAQIIAKIQSENAPEIDTKTAAARIEQAAGRMGRALNTDGIKELFYANIESPRWEAIAQKCIGCANCTMVCPTCFCTTVEDTTSLDGDEAQRTRKWDSCFTMPYSHIHGGSVRTSLAARYRQWISHKLANWIDQFGSSGCVGCGRCITWCPVGIDITAETAALSAAQAPRESLPERRAK